MRVISLSTAAALALGAASCAPHVNYAARTALDCPDRQGELVRTSISADRKTCTYRAGEGVDVSLQLTPVSGDAGQTLNAIEASLVGPAPAPAAEGAATAAPPAPPPKPPAPPAPPSGDAAKVAEQAAQDARGSGASDEDWSAGRDRAEVTDGQGRGVVVEDGGHGEHAHINLPGVHIEADDHNARVNVGGIRIDAAEGEATIHVFREVRLPGQGFSREKDGVRATFIAKRDNLPDGYRFVGYQASGPKKGPLSVAVVKSRESLDDNNRLYHDIQRLVRRNGGA